VQVQHTRRKGPAARVIEEFSLPRATMFGGANLLLDYLEAVGLRRILDECVSVHKRPDSAYSMADVLTVLVVGWMLGLERIFHFQDIERDPLLTLKLGLNKLPDHTLLYKDLARFDSPEKVNSLKETNRRILSRVLGRGDHVILDFDSTVETLYGEQEGAEVGYNPDRHGRPSYHPLLVFDGRSRACLNAALRPGDAHTAEGFIAFYEHTVSMLPPGVKVGYVRMDKGFAGEDIYRFLEGKEVGYVGKVKVTERLLSWGRTLDWRRIEDGEWVIEVASGEYCATTWRKSRRVVLVRKRLAEPEENVLLEELLWDHDAMVTNLDWDEEDIWRFYNQRCAAENYIKEAKHGFFIGDVPTAEFYPNYADLLLKVMAYNLSLGLKAAAEREVQGHRTMATLRRLFLQIPAVLVRRGRSWVLRLWRESPRQQEYRRLRIAICGAT